VQAAGEAFFPPSIQGDTPLRYVQAGPLRLSGLLWPESEAALRGAAALIDQPLGQGCVIAFQNQPGMRDLHHALTPILLNTLLFAPAMGGRSPQF
jgi:hypothetical protein